MTKKNKVEDLFESSENELQDQEETEVSTSDTNIGDLNSEGQLDQENMELKAQVQELKDKYLRSFAEFENFRKRSMKQQLELMKTAAQDTMSVLLPVLDDFDRAKKSADSPDSPEQFSEGVELVYQKIYKVLEAKGLKAMESTNQPFDADLHEAITEISVPMEEMKGKVIDTVEKGYFLNDKIIRHAKVVVGK